MDKRTEKRVLKRLRALMQLYINQVRQIDDSFCGGAVYFETTGHFFSIGHVSLEDWKYMKKERCQMANSDFDYVGVDVTNDTGEPKDTVFFMGGTTSEMLNGMLFCALDLERVIDWAEEMMIDASGVSNIYFESLRQLSAD